MAESYSRTDPMTGASTTMPRRAGSGGAGEDRTSHYQAEIDRLRSDMSKLAETVGGSLRSTVQPVARELEAAVVRNPTASVAIAAGAGLILGLIMARK